MLRVHKMKTLPKIHGKKGINDISIITILIFIFFGTAIMIPFINEAFNTQASSFNLEGLDADIQQDSRDIREVGAFDIDAFNIFLTVLKLAFFDFGGTLGMPFWLQAVYSILAIVFTMVIARNIWVGGGG